MFGLKAAVAMGVLIECDLRLVVILQLAREGFKAAENGENCRCSL